MPGFVGVAPLRTRTKRRTQAGGILLTMLMLLSACGGAERTGSGDIAAPAADTPSALVGSFETLDGAQFDLASLEGQDAVLWFWAPW